MGELSGLCEYSSMNYCMSEIPQRVRRGLSIVDVHITCLDVVEEFIVIGTNIGVVYWCNRKTNKTERLRPEKYGPTITTVKVVSTVDYMVAAGDSSGVVSIFIIPKQKPIFLPDHLNSKRGIERFTADDLHSSSITALVWSTNGQKLFSGDEKGVVAYTQMDFQLNIIKSTEILNEKFSIVQLAYRSQVLLVASEYRCIIYKQSADLSDQRIHQVGQKERVSVNKLGALISSQSSHPSLVIFSARSKQRICLANTEGTVCSTLLFKVIRKKPTEPLSRSYPEIQILRPFGTADLKSQESSRNSYMTSSADSLSSISCDIEFSYLHEFRNKYLVAHNEHSLVLLNPANTTVEAGYTTKKIVSVAVHKDEIFVLESSRRIRRISFSTDPYSVNKYCNVNLEMPLGDKLLGMVHKIKEETSINMVQSLMENFKKVENIVVNSEVLNGEEGISPAEEALEFYYPKDGNPHEYSTRPLRTSYNVDDTCSDDIVHNRQKKKSGKIVEKGNEFRSHSGEMKNCDNYVNNERDEPQAMNDVERTSFDSPHCLRFEDVPTDIMPDLRTPTSIMQDVEFKGSLIAQLLDIPFVNRSEILPDTKDEDHVSVINNDDLVRVNQPSFSESGDIEVPELKTSMATMQIDCESVHPQTLEQELQESDESIIVEGITKEAISTEANVSNVENDTVAAEELNSSDLAIIHSCCEKSWRQFRARFPVKWICLSGTDVFCGSVKQSVYRASYKQFQLRWEKQKYRASKMAVSRSGDILLKVNLGVLSALKNADDSDSWQVIAGNVESVAINDWSVWYVSGGLLFVQTSFVKEQTSAELVKVHCDYLVSKVCSFDNNVWVLTVDGIILDRKLVSPKNPLGSGWRKISYPDTVTVSDIALGTRNTGWIVDKFNNIYFTDNFASENASWWQVIIGRHIYRSDSTLSDQLSRFVWSKEKPSSSVICSAAESVWVSMSNENVLCINKTAVLGHNWSSIPVDSSLMFKTKWKFLAAVGEHERTSAVWCLSSSNDLFLYFSKRNYIRAVEMATTNDVVCVTAVPDMMWILTDKNEIYVRRGISEQTPFGWAWEQLRIYQVQNSISSFKHMSIGRDIIWAISADDKIYAAIADLYSITGDTFVLDWVLIENPLAAETKLIDVIVGPNKYMVWALDDKYNVYTRLSIFDHFPYGTEWVNVPGIKAIHLTLSSSAVWALTAEGYVYRRSGITPEDPVGEYWAQVPGCLSLITASVYENMWGVSKITGRLLKYENHLLGLNEDVVRKRRFSENIEDEWEIVEDVHRVELEEH